MEEITKFYHALPFDKECFVSGMANNPRKNRKLKMVDHM